VVSANTDKSKEQTTTPNVDPNLESSLAKQPPRALNSPIRIFQIYFEAWQRELLDPAFYPLDNSRGNSELMEFAVFEQLQKCSHPRCIALGCTFMAFWRKDRYAGCRLG
jgi:hypothetical protein